jgi:ubiquinone/menaquinone biosynthesis C-methylase UbiE/uncharacterized protein YbaR (Trm112 family)
MVGIKYCCPRCKGELVLADDLYTCNSCTAAYPIVLGIPDFRVFPDPFISIVEDRKKAERISERAAGSDFASLVDYYWSITPDTPVEMARRFTAQAIAALERGCHLLDAHPAVKAKLQEPDACVLDLGTRTGGLLMAATQRSKQAVGIDIALRWLIIARKRLDDAKLPAQLVCCCAEFLPFPDETFGVVVAENLLEHTAQAQACVGEAHRVLKRAGVFFTTSWNRFALAPEPHVRLWGVGWLPRKMAKRYVKLRKGITYDHVRLRSAVELMRMMRRGSFQSCNVILPMFSPSELKDISPPQQMAIAIYHRIKNWPLFRVLLRMVAPVLHLVCVRDSR